MTDTPLMLRFDMTVTKTSVDPDTGERRIRMSASDTGPDCFGESMSLELFNNFVARIASGEVPVVFRSVLREKSGWEGGMPYASISHYKSGTEGKNIPADIRRVYVDGKVLKSVAIVRDNVLGNQLWANLLADKDGTSKFENKIRVSIGFLDLKHSHGDFVFERDSLAKHCPMCENGSTKGKVYLDGILVHEAFTRVPANPRTDVEVEKMADNITTREGDAESIVGKDGLDELEVNKSAIQDEPLLVEKSADADMDEEHPADCTCKACASKKPEKTEVVTEPMAEVIPAAPVAEKTELEAVFEELKSAIGANAGVPKADALRNVQPVFNKLGEVVQKSFVEQPVEAPKAAPITQEELLAQFSALLDAKLSPLQVEIQTLKSQAAVKPLPAEEVPAPRSLQVERSMVPQAPVAQKSAFKISELVEMTTKFG